MVNMRVTADYISVLHEVLLSWLRILSIFLLFGGVVFFVLQSFTQSWSFIYFLTDFFRSFLVISIVSSLAYMPYLLIQSYIFKELIQYNKLDWYKARYIGAFMGVIYGFLISNFKMDQTFTPFMLPFFGGLAGFLIGHFVFPKFEKKFLFHKTYEVAEVTNNIQHGKKIKFSTLFEIVVLSFWKSIFVTLTIVFLFICIKEGDEFLGMLIGGFIYFLFSVVIGCTIGIAIAFPCIILACFVYMWLLKKDHNRVIIWILASLFIGQIYILLLNAISGEDIAKLFVRFFYIPVSTLTGYFSWREFRKFNSNLLLADKVEEPKII
jgi:hypothetical protein